MSKLRVQKFVFALKYSSDPNLAMKIDSHIASLVMIFSKFINNKDADQTTRMSQTPNTDFLASRLIYLIISRCINLFQVTIHTMGRHFPRVYPTDGSNISI